MCARFLRALAGALLALGCGDVGDAPRALAPAVTASPARHPDVLLITLDTLRADHVGAYGAPRGATPQLDALAEESVVFERAVAASSRTAPSHASLFTSSWVRDHSIGYRNGATQLGDEATLAAILAAAGYDTAAFVSNSMLRRRIGLDRGFAHYDDRLPDSESNRPVFERVAEKTTKQALAFLARERQAPLFLWVHYNDPHGPYGPPPAYLEGPWNGPRDEPALPALEGQRGIRGIPAYQVMAEERRPADYRTRYAGEIRYLDAWLGRLLDAFDERSGPGAIVAVTADHGESLGEEGFYFSHGYGTAPNLAHVPFLLRAPGLAAQRIAAPVHHVDLLPTLLELVGLPQPPGAAGVALGPGLRGEAALPGDRDLFVDVGAEVSLYRGDTFLRARLGDDLGPVQQGSRQAFRWQSGSVWQPIEPSPELAHRAEQYAAERAVLRRAPPLGSDDEARLRALGYLEPEARWPATRPRPPRSSAPPAADPGSR
jgi:arylsulfatase